MAFNLGRVTDSQNRLQRDFIEFARLWADVKDDWLDERRNRFERDHLSTLGPSLNRLSTTLQDFAEAVRKAERQLADDGADRP